jgi:hypothetical protein
VICALRQVNGQVKEDEIGKAYSTSGDKLNSYDLLVGTPEGKRSLRRTKCKWMGNIKIDL